MIKFLFMDERFAHPNDNKALQATALTGLLVDPGHHASFRDAYYRLVHDAIGWPPKDAATRVIPRLPHVHALSLFPDADDDARVTFLEGLVALAVEMTFSVYRIGYRKNRHVSEASTEKDVLQLCFVSVRHCLHGKEPGSMIWPVMELDRSHGKQDQHFPGSQQNIDWYTSILGPGSMSVDNAAFGEALFHSKQSAYGAMVDCFSYLLHCRFVRSTGQSLTPYKQRMAGIADQLDPIIKYDEVIDLQTSAPPPDYVSDGPIRWVYPITPSD